ncbi:MAG: peptidase MA family metallohydrolase [Syntrophomonadaceae bacterium]|nr:peptidase MA family metallohydrolase [Syntrophomonadaceae bacterium]MDD3024843.1 peptidase MA family metallohydrolase [Syntrophomonadaceae bacterium]
MWEIKSGEILRTTALVLIIIMVLALLLSKNSNAIMRVMVGQEVKLKTAGFAEMQTQHFIIKYTAADKDYMGIIAESAEAAALSVKEEFDWESNRQTILVVYPNGQSLASSFGWDKNEKAMGVYWGGSIRVLSPREWLFGDDIKERFIKEGPMVHEFTHLMVDEISQGNYNRWWTEGIAQYAEKKITGFQFADPFTGGENLEYYTLEKLAKEFDRLDQQVAYWESLKVVEYIVDQYGEEEIFDILEQLGQKRTMEQSVHDCLGIDYNTFEKNFYHSLKE